MRAADVWINFYGYSDLKNATTIHIVNEDDEAAVEQEMGDSIFDVG